MNTWLVVLCALLAMSTIVFAFLYFREKKDLEEVRDQAQRALSHQSEDFEEEKEGIQITKTFHQLVYRLFLESVLFAYKYPQVLLQLYLWDKVMKYY